MNHVSLADIGQQIAQLEKELSKLYSKRVEALEAELKQAQSRIGSFGGSPAPVAKAAVVKAPAAQPVKRKGRPARKPQQTAPAPAKAVEEPKAEPVAQPLLRRRHASPGSPRSAPGRPQPSSKRRYWTL